ncbi:MAG: DUF4159 domain-containing protein [Chloroflexota bacterium]|nr:DUF4159 domain-containing protein [Chloroflexota bacterium]
MELEDVTRFQLRRVNPFPGLMIDVDIWQEAHNYHRDQQRLHLLTFHQTGIMAGLEVIANDPPDLSVTINPGIGIDSEGNNIIVSSAQRYTIQARQSGMVYLVIQFREIPSGPYQPPDGGQPTRIMEAYRIQEREELPTEAFLELARIDFDPANPTLHNPRIMDNPGKNEVDHRFRRIATAGVPVQAAPPLPIIPPPAVPTPAVSPPAPEQVKTDIQNKEPSTTRETITIGHVSVGTMNAHTHSEGLHNLAREINRQYDFAVDVKSNVLLDVAIEKCNILYITGNASFELSEQQKRVMREFLESGGMIFGEACAEEQGETPSRGPREFGLAFNQLASQLNRKLENVQRGHPLLSAIHTFSGVPQGAVAGMLLEGGNMIYSGSDYGCAWRGGFQDNPLPRDSIRSSVEMGANIIIYAQMNKT